MIHHISGKLTKINPSNIVVEAGGVGYLIRSVSSPEDWNLNHEVTILTRQITNDNGSELFGFPDEDTRDLFDLLVKHVGGIGPTTAMNILVNIKTNVFKEIVAEGDTARLSTVKGIGKKNAERIVVELRDKVGIANIWKTRNTAEDPVLQDAILALIALGHTKASAEKSATAARKAHPDANAQELTRAALK